MGTGYTTEVIVGVRTESHQDKAALRLALHQLKQSINIRNVSSIYRFKSQSAVKLPSVHEIHSSLQFDGYVVALIGATELAPRELLQCLEAVNEIEHGPAMRRGVTCFLYFYGEQTQMLPNLTIPHPEFHLCADHLLPVVEIAPNFIHPVLRKALQQLATPYAHENCGEFIGQGKALLDY
jgi:7,8-dihydro-6-hydroxymethylpterin-pyrophosphokinase